MEESKMDIESNEIWGDDNENGIDQDVLSLPKEEIMQRVRLLDNEIRIMRSDIQRITHESSSQKERVKENKEKIKLNKQLPYLVSNIVEVLTLPIEEDEDGGATDVNAIRTGKSAVIKTSTRQVDIHWFL